jgi:aspartate kinase
MAAKLFGLLAQHNISVDMIIQSQRCRIINGLPSRDIAFTLAQMDAEAAKTTLEQAADLGWGEVVVDNAIAKVSIVGAGMVGQPGVAAKMFAALASTKLISNDRHLRNQNQLCCSPRARCCSFTSNSRRF